MKTFRASFFNFLIVAAVIALKPPAGTRAEVIVAPKAITVNATTITVDATQGTVATRTLTLRTSQEINGLRVIVFDSYREDGRAILPATAIQVSPPPSQVKANGIISFPIQFDLRHAPSGEFTSEVLLTYQGGEQIIPVIVKVKDTWFLPLLTLLGGMGLGMAVSAYGSRSPLNDEISASWENLRKQIDAEQAQARSFWSRADLYLAIAKHARDARQFETAQDALENARAIWNRWLQQRPNWLIQFRYYDTLHQSVALATQKAPIALYLQAVGRDLDKMLQSAPDLATPDELQQKLDSLSQQLNLYSRLMLRLDRLRELSAELAGESRYDWQDRVEDMQRQLDTVLPSQPLELKALKEEMDEGIEQLRAVVSYPPVDAKLADSHAIALLNPGSPSPGLSLSLVEEAQEVRSAKSLIKLRQLFTNWLKVTSRRSQLLFLSSYLISFTVLAGGGFNELYLSRPTFGARGWGDYFTLLVLGFGVEATRNLVTQAARKNESEG